MFWLLRPKNSKRRPPETLGFRDHEVQLTRQAYRRSIGITLQVNGCIRVKAPKSVPVARIHAFLREHSDWIDANLEKYKGLRAKHPRKYYRDGELFPFLGREIRLKFLPGASGRLRIEAQDDELRVWIPRAAWSEFTKREEHPELASLIGKHFASVGKTVLQDRVRVIGERMGRQPKVLVFRSQKTRWGSCSTRGSISLNWRLIVAPLEVIDYVVAHELAHLTHHNHSTEFWNLVAREVPEFERYKAWLRVNQFTADFLAKRSELHPA